MRCHICDREIPVPAISRARPTEPLEIQPCLVCLDEIQTILESYKDRPFVDEDELQGVGLGALLPEWAAPIDKYGDLNAMKAGE